MSPVLCFPPLYVRMYMHAHVLMHVHVHVSCFSLHTYILVAWRYKSCLHNMQIVEDLLELLFRCMFVAPVTSLQHVIADSEPSQLDPSPDHTTIIPFTVDPDYQQAVTCIMEEDGCLLASFDSSVRGHFIGLTPMTVGKYLWKVCLSVV